MHPEYQDPTINENVYSKEIFFLCRDKYFKANVICQWRFYIICIPRGSYMKAQLEGPSFIYEGLTPHPASSYDNSKVYSINFPFSSCLIILTKTPQDLPFVKSWIRPWSSLPLIQCNYEAWIIVFIIILKCKGYIWIS